MEPEHERRQQWQDGVQAEGWQSLEHIVRQALTVQRDLGTANAVEFLRKIGVSPTVIARVLAPEAQLREADQLALANSVAVAELPVASAAYYWRCRQQ
ncbi:hypothetical protein ACFFKC_12180 [Pseudoduganella danionis]|uniref:Uncharacterized protein n=1 Tax=Pseudoduganella danionis TaxID=1890295 RepID=A0ABW9SJP8_9BURK|nr:hypothetical protein [Pseudoduganella danionis]MTW32227.1 hypothetical protein [Pseudoduganella danionis]